MIGGTRRALAVAVLSSSLALPAKADTLSIPPVFQATPVWCWLAVAEMVFTHYNVPALNPVNYQCGLAALIHPVCMQNCFACPISGGPVSTLLDVLRQYPRYTQFRGSISGSLRFHALSRNDLKDEIDNSRPVIAGISPGGFSAPNVSQHVVLIVGYEQDGNDLTLVVNDPFPFGHPMFSGQPNPYVRAGGREIDAGQYTIRYERFRDSLRWANSVTRIRCQGPDC